jgi:hypothetical protein
MDNNHQLKSFFESPFAEDYINCTDYLVRKSVTGISASCELLRKFAEKNGGKAEQELIGGIMTACCELMRNAELSRALSAPLPEEQELTAVRTDLFLSGFAKSCETAAQGKCTVKTRKLSASYVRTDRNALRLLLLSFVRRHILGAESGKAAFFIECGENAKNLEIKITASGTFVDFDDFGQPDVFSGYHSQVCIGLAERAGASAVVDNGSLTVAIPLAYGNSEPVAEAPAPEHENGFFDAFNIMLRDLSERK